MIGLRGTAISPCAPVSASPAIGLLLRLDLIGRVADRHIAGDPVDSRSSWVMS